MSYLILIIKSTEPSSYSSIKIKSLWTYLTNIIVNPMVHSEIIPGRSCNHLNLNDLIGIIKNDSFYVCTENTLQLRSKKCWNTMGLIDSWAAPWLILKSNILIIWDNKIYCHISFTLYSHITTDMGQCFIGYYVFPSTPVLVRDHIQKLSDVVSVNSLLNSAYEAHLFLSDYFEMLKTRSSK